MDIINQLRCTISNFDDEDVFVVDDASETSYTYFDFFSRCYHLANAMDSIPQKKLFVVMDNGIELIALFFATIISKKEIIVVDPEKGLEEILTLYNEVEHSFPIILKKGIEKNETIPNAFHSNDFSNMHTCCDIVDSINDYSLHGDYLTTYTSGTSGETKGVVNSLYNLFYASFAIAEKLDVKTNGTFLHLMPMSYMAGILNSIFMPFVMGYRIVLRDRFSIKSVSTFWPLIQKYTVNLLWASPMMLMMVDKMDRGTANEQYCKSHKICFLIGTAPLSPELRCKFEQRYNQTLFASYGLSETLFISVETNNSIRDKKEDNVGELLSGVEYKISEDGELMLKVPWMFNGYSNVDTSSYFLNGYYLSGDLACIKNNVIYILGRKKDLIIRGGLNISPKKIEDCISKTEAFIEYSVFGRKNRFGEEEVCCAYIIGNDSDETGAIKMVSSKVREELGPNYAINSFLRVSEIPRNLNGKVDKNALRRM